MATYRISKLLPDAFKPSGSFSSGVSVCPGVLLTSTASSPLSADNLPYQQLPKERKTAIRLSLLNAFDANVHNSSTALTDSRSPAILTMACKTSPHLFANVSISRQTVSYILQAEMRKREKSLVVEAGGEVPKKRKCGPQPHPRPPGVIDTSIALRFVTNETKQVAANVITSLVKARVPMNVRLASCAWYTRRLSTSSAHGGQPRLGC